MTSVSKLEKMKILLINPPTRHTSRSNNPRVYLPLGLLYIAAMLEKNNYKVQLYDTLLSGKLIKKGDITHFGDSWDKIKQVVKKISPDVVGISNMFSNQLPNALKVAELSKEVNKDITVIMGGPHASINPKDLLKNDFVDVVIIGEGEYTILDIMKHLDKKINLKEIKGIAYKENENIIINEKASPIKNLDELPFPAYHLIDMERYFYLQTHGFGQRPLINGKRPISMITSRGCPFNCIFCSVHLHMGKLWRAHSPQYILNHINYLICNYNIDFILFEDDNMSLGINRFKAILNLIINKNLKIKWGPAQGVRADTLDIDTLKLMKKSGCSYLVIAIESGDQRVLNEIIGKNMDLSKVIEIVKAAKKIKLETYSFYIIGFPGETLNNIRSTINFAKELDDKYGVFPLVHIATPLLGTRLFKICKEKGYLIKDVNEESLLIATQFHGDGLIKTPEFTPDDLKKENDRLNRNIIKNLIKRSFSNPRLFINYLSTTLKNPYLIKKYLFKS